MSNRYTSVDEGADISLHEYTPPQRKPVASESIKSVDSDIHKHTRAWSGSTQVTFADETDEIVPKQHHHGSWTVEFLGLAVGALAVAAILIVLALFNNSPLPNWPFRITLNTIIALLAAIANVAITVPLSSGFSQLKWVWFKRRPSPLGDLELFDDASRGSWGAVRLLARGRGGPLGIFGAIITLTALVLGTFSQQVATFPTRDVVSKSAASIPGARNYTGVLPGDSITGFVPILPMKAAAYNGLFAEAGPAQPKFSCPTGNCTYNDVTTLAVCGSCVDITPFMSRCPDAACAWQVPQGAMLLNSTDVFSMTSILPTTTGNMPYSSIIRLIFMGTEAQDGLPLNYNPWATQCSLEYCAQTIDATVVDGSLQETVTSTIRNATVLDSTESNGVVPVSLSTPNNGSVFISEPAKLGIQSWFSTLFRNGSASRNSSFEGLDPRALVVVNLTVGISSGTTFFDSDIVQTFYWDYYEYTDGLPRAMNDLATAMTVAFRSFNGAEQIYGTATSVQTYVKVQWGWISLPLFVVLATGLFLALAVVSSRRSGTELWKGSALALLFYGLDHATKVQFASPSSFEAKKKVMRNLHVQLSKDNSFGSVLRS